MRRDLHPQPADGTSALRELCICADDFGLSTGINIAVLQLAERGRISATGCMVRRGAWQAGARSLRRLDPLPLDVGVQLDLPTHMPGHEHLRAEIRSQLSAFENDMGRAPAFVDGHSRVLQFPLVRHLLVEEVLARYGSAPPWLRLRVPVQEHPVLSNREDLLLLPGGQALRRLASRNDIPISSRLLGTYDFEGGAKGYRARLQCWIDECRSGDVLICHPSVGMLPGDAIATARLDEYEVLSTFNLDWASRHRPVRLATLPDGHTH